MHSTNFTIIIATVTLNFTSIYMQIIYGYEVMAVVPKTITVQKFSNNKKSNNNKQSCTTASVSYEVIMNAIPAATEETATIQSSCIAIQKHARLMLLQNMTLLSNCYGY